MNTLGRYYLMRVYTTIHRFYKIIMTKLEEGLLKSIKEDITEFIDIHLDKYFDHWFVVIAFNRFAERHRIQGFFFTINQL